MSGMNVSGDVWIGDDTDEYWVEGVKALVEVEATDVDEVRVGVRLTGEDTDAATIYLSRAGADKLARFLAAVSVEAL